MPVELPCFRCSRVRLTVLRQFLVTARTRMRMMPFSRISSRCGLAGDTVCRIGRSVCLAVHPVFVSGPSLAERWLALSAVAAALAFGGHAAMAADDAPAAGSSFQTEDISIGEPISLPSDLPMRNSMRCSNSVIPPLTPPKPAMAAHTITSI